LEKLRHDDIEVVYAGSGPRCPEEIPVHVEDGGQLGNGSGCRR